MSIYRGKKEITMTYDLWEQEMLFWLTTITEAVAADPAVIKQKHATRPILPQFFKAHNPSMEELYVVQKSRSRDTKALKLCKGRSANKCTAKINLATQLDFHTTCVSRKRQK